MPIVSGKLKIQEQSQRKNHPTTGLYTTLFSNAPLPSSLSSTLQCSHFELPTTFPYILVPLSLSSCCSLFFLRKSLLLLLGPAQRSECRAEALCTLVLFSPCSQAGGAPLLSARRALPSTEHSGALTSECTKFKFWLRRVCGCVAPGPLPGKPLISSI